MRGSFFLFFHDVIDGFGGLLFFLFYLLLRLFFGKGAPADDREFCDMYDDYAYQKDAEGEEGAPTLYGEKFHNPIIKNGFCHKLEKKRIFFLVFGKTEDMETRTFTEAEAAEFEEFQRMRRETEAALTLKKIAVDASARETDRHALLSACDLAKKQGMCAVLVSPVNVSAARRRLNETQIQIACVVGGTGESLLSVKKTEAKRARAQGAKIIRLVPCYSALISGNAAYLKREIKKVRRATKKCSVVLSLDDHALSKEEIERGLCAAAEGKADGVSLRGEVEYALLAVRYAAGRFGVEASGVENAAQTRMLFKAGVERVSSREAERVSEELYGILTAERRAEDATRTNTKKNETAK